MKIIVTGGRDFKNVQLVNRLLTALSPEILVVGDCPTGADLFAREWGVKRKLVREYVELIVYEADWDAAERAGNRNSAGPIRNAAMVKAHRDANFLLAFPGDRGTRDCIEKAHAAGLPVLTVGPP